MKKSEIKLLVQNLVIVVIAIGLAIAGSQGGVTIFGGFPLFALLIIIAFLFQWIAYIPAIINKTEKYYDLTGSLTYTTVTILAVIFNPTRNLRSYILMFLVLIWTGRLGIFLFRRILKSGKDNRFEAMKKSPLEFLRAWTLQGLWVSFTAAAALAAITANKSTEMDTLDWIFLIVGLIIWILGFGFEAIADNQKKKFISNPDNRGKFINVGLWTKSRHPNYFGEITLWFGIALIALPTLQGWRYVALISPIFVILLLTKISGLPIAEKYSDNKWGGQEAYELYKKQTPVLIPKLPFK